MFSSWFRLKLTAQRLTFVAAAGLVGFGALGAVNHQTARADGSPTVVYVSPSGNDSNSGLDAADPVQTLAQAQQIVRGINTSVGGDVDVELAGGVYRLTSPLAFTSADSGNGGTVTWKSASGQTAVISSAIQISGWTQVKNGIWSASVPAGLSTRQIYVNGARAYLASGQLPVTLKTTSTGYTASSTLLSTWKNPSQIDFVYPGSLGYMVEPICPVASISGKTITMAEPCWDNSNKRGSTNIVGYPGSTLGSPAYMENALPLLTQPGQFYLDESAHVLYYMPRPGQDMATADVEAPTLESLVDGAGTAGDPVHNIAFSNIQFSYATWLQPGTPDGFSEEQAGYYLTGANAYQSEGLCGTAQNGTCPFGNWTKEPGNVQFSYDQNISFTDDQFVHLGAAALNLDDGSQNDAVTGSVFTDVSGNGIELGNVDHPQASGNSATVGNTITDNVLSGIPVEFHGGVPILAGYVSNSVISHNDIHDIPWAAISIGWGGWLDKLGQSPVANNMHDNAITDNEIDDFMEGLKDGGGVYTQGIQGPSLQHGLTVSGNVISNQMDWGGALKADNGTANVTYSGNVLFNNFYDWDYDVNCCGSSVTMQLTNNYWQQGDFPPAKYPNVAESGNTLITGASDAPSDVTSNAGLEPAYSPLATYVLEGSAAPSAPQMMSALYAFKGKAYITWHPSYDSGSDPVTSYTIYDCKAGTTGACAGPRQKKITVSASKLTATGYAVCSGLSNGKPSDIWVTANNADGSSIGSIPTLVTSAVKAPKTLAAPTGLSARTENGYVSLMWTKSKSTKGVQNLVVGHTSGRAAASPNSNNFVLGYSIVNTTTKQKYSLTSHIALVETNTNGRVVYVVKGLTPGKTYNFTVAAINPAGTGKAATVSIKVK